jgi:PhoH-like ATPase
LCGSQGSGKTLLGYVSSVLQVLSDGELKSKGQDIPATLQYGAPGRFKQIVLLKSNDILGGAKRDVGFLPGSLYEKIKPHITPYIDAHRESVLGSKYAFEEMFKHPVHETDFGKRRSEYASNTSIDGKFLPNNEAVELTYSGYLRGRSFSNTLMIIDEAQNFTPYEMKTIIERAGEGCKIIIMGDPLQQDNPDCSSKINGLTHAIKHYLPKPYSALVSLGTNYRSIMSRDATDWKAYRV